MFGLEKSRLKTLLAKPKVGRLHLNVLERVVEALERNQPHIVMSLERDLRSDSEEFRRLAATFTRAAMARTEAIVTQDRERLKRDLKREMTIEHVQNAREAIGGQEAGMMAVEKLLEPLKDAMLVKTIWAQKAIVLHWWLNEKKLKQAIAEAKRQKGW